MYSIAFVYMLNVLIFNLLPIRFTAFIFVKYRFNSNFLVVYLVVLKTKCLFFYY